MYVLSVGAFIAITVFVHGMFHVFAGVKLTWCHWLSQ